MNSPLYAELKTNIEQAQKEGKTAVCIDNSSGLSADQIHAWFPHMEVKWDKTNRITICWA
jgi:NAD(P)H-hydrate repair Nnr-like enzyme with NAD(P)H-hydrate epimerase domain